MSKRKVDPMAQAILDLKYLERVVKALEVLRGADARVRALLAGGPQSAPPGWTHTETKVLPNGGELRRYEMPAPAGTATLDTPERQEYEAAKREGRTVPDPFADPFRNATPEQRERMAEQRAAIAAEKARRGLPAKIAAVGALNEAGAVSPEDVETVVSTEELATGANGSFGAAVSVTATDERLSPEESDG